MIQVWCCIDVSLVITYMNKYGKPFPYTMVDYTLIRYSHGDLKFEILVKPDPALEYRSGKKISPSSVLVSDDIYTDSGQGTRASDENLQKAFGTSDTVEVATIILNKGVMNLTTEQRRRMTEAKRLQIIERIAKSYVDPRTHLPHPPLRIQQAIRDARVVIDPQKPAEEQISGVVDRLRSIIPLKTEQMLLEVSIPAQFASHSYSVLQSVGTLKTSDWLPNGSLKAILEISAATKQNVIDKLNQITRGAASVEISR